MVSKQWALTAAVVLGGANVASAQFSTYKVDAGYAQLKTELGNAAPTGDGVPVSHVETFQPNPAGFPGKTINYYPATSNYSSLANDNDHGNKSAANLFGNGFTQGIAPGITQVDAFTQTGWQFGTYLNIGGTGQPAVSPNKSRVSSHSYHYPSSNPDGFVNMYRRMDWTAAQDDILHVVGVTGSGVASPLGGNFNGMTVSISSGGGPRQGTHGFTNNPVYAAGRTKPDIVFMSDASGATPTVGAMAALLFETAHKTPALSMNRSYVNTARYNTTVYEAETVEVIKATLMAGAKRNWQNTWEGSSNSTYRQGNVTIDSNGTLAPAATANGLDRRFGAGQANIYNSYKILTGGQDDSREDNGGIGGAIGEKGWDYDGSFGGAGGSNNAASYFFTPETVGKFTASLVWNVQIASGTAIQFNGTPTLYDLDLNLIDLSAGNSVVASSLSTIDNTENIWTDLLAGHSYKLEVSTKSAAFNWDYGLAWDYTGTFAVPEPATLSLLALGGLMLARRRR